jgi:hypothetical protein
VEADAEDRLACAAAAGALGQTLSAAGERGAADRTLDEAQLRILRGPDDVARERHLEARAEAEPVDGRDRRDRQLLQPADRRHAVGEPLPGLVEGHALEERYVGPTREGIPVRS